MTSYAKSHVQRRPRAAAFIGFVAAIEIIWTAVNVFL